MLIKKERAKNIYMTISYKSKLNLAYISFHQINTLEFVKLEDRQNEALC